MPRWRTRCPTCPIPTKRSSLISTPRRCGSTTTSTTRPTSTTRTRRWTARSGQTAPSRTSCETSSLPADKQGPVRNNAGGHANHSLFWTVMSPDGGGEPSGDLAGGDRRLRRLRRTSSRRPGSRASAVGGVARLGRLGRRDHVDGESGQPAERRQGSPPAPTSGNTPTTCATRTAARTTSPPGGTSSPGTRWRAVRGGARLSRTPTRARSSPAARGAPARRSSSTCGRPAGRSSRRAPATATSPRSPRPLHSSSGPPRLRRPRRLRQRRVGRLHRIPSRRSKRPNSTPRSARRSRELLRRQRRGPTPAGLAWRRGHDRGRRRLPAVATFSAHCAAKAAQAMLTRAPPRRWRRRCASSASRPVPSQSSRGQEARRARETALGRVGRLADVAAAIVYLAGASFVTGTTLVVDGGRLLQPAQAQARRPWDGGGMLELRLPPGRREPRASRSWRRRLSPTAS